MNRNSLKLALKVLMRRRFFTFVSFFGVALTLLVLLVATALLDQFVFPQGVERRFDRTLTLRSIRLAGENWVMETPAGYKLLDDYVETLQTPELVAAYGRQQKVASYQGPSKIELYLKRTDGDYWRILDFDFVEGRAISADDERDARFVAVINEATRRKLFGEAPAAGKWIEVDGQRFRVIGVVRDVSFLQTAAFSDVWVPISTAKTADYRESLHGDFIGLVMARNRSEIAKVKDEFAAMVKQVQLPSGYQSLEAFAETRFEGIARALPPGSPLVARLIFIGGALLFMTLPAVNLINLNLSRILERSSEIGVRKAFGASSSRLVGQFVVENVVLTVLGGLIGLLCAAVVLAGINETGLIPYAQLRINYRIFAYGLAMAVIFGLMSGVYPAWRMSRLHPVQALRGGAR